MSEEKPKVQMPRRPEKRKPAPKRDLRKSDQKKIDQVEDDSLLLSLDERACALLCTERSPEDAAAILGWDLQAVHDVLSLPHVRLFLKKADEAVIAELAKAKVRRMTKVGISRASIEQRFWELANMTPEDTRGNIDGQVKALRALAEVMGYASKEKDPLEGKTPDELRAIVAKGHSKLIEGKVERSVN